MPAGYESLSVLRVNRMMQALVDVRSLPGNLLFLKRTPVTPAFDEEIMARWVGRIQIADLISDDAKANVYTAGKFSLEQTNAPNIKVGANLTQAQMNQILGMEAAGGIPRSDVKTSLSGDVLRNTIDNLLLGVRQRMEYLLVGMAIDSLSYDRFGFKATGITWGMPSDLKVTTSIPWTDSVNADPVNDIWTLLLIASNRYGMTYNRMTMSRQAFQYMISCVKFQNIARAFIPPQLTFTNVNTLNLAQQKILAQNALGLDEIEFYDNRYYSQDSAGNLTSARFLPINNVILSDTANDNDATVQDWANGIVTETALSGMLPNQGTSMIGRFGGAQRGPVSYASVPPDLNPPNVTMWAVARGFPRKFKLQANAVLSIGAVTDSISTVDPF